MRVSHRDGLYYLEEFRMQNKSGIKEVQSAQLVISLEKDLLIWHKHHGHPAFKVFESLAPAIYKNVIKTSSNVRLVS